MKILALAVFVTLAGCGGGGRVAPQPEPFGTPGWDADRFYFDMSRDRWLGPVPVDVLMRTVVP